MNNFFNINSPFFTALNKICDILVLSIVWFVVCIPIVTIGPANTALYYATVKVIRRERSYLVREFFKSFRLNFKKGAIIGIVLTAIFGILAIDLAAAGVVGSGSGSVKTVFKGVYIALTLFVLCFSLYVFPVLSRFDMSIKQLVKACLYMAIRHLFSTLGMLVIFALSVGAVYIMPLALVFIPATYTLSISLIMEKILKKYMPKSDETGDNTGKDEWYLE